ncbi:MAG: PucR family transcriptional regulator [Bilophila wadsworthia]
MLQVLRAIEPGPLLDVEGLGVYGNLTLLTRNHEDAQPAFNIAALREEDSALFDTLELFLDNAGSIAKTSEELCIHRSTLYYRLKRIADITGTDLNSGLDRFTLHLELKLFRLTSVLLGDDEPATA